MGRPALDVMSRIVGRSVAAANGCVRWTGSHTPLGYGQISVRGRMEYVHREVWRDAHGPIPRGHEVHHWCETRDCTQLDHLRLLPVGDHRAHHNRRRSHA